MKKIIYEKAKKKIIKKELNIKWRRRCTKKGEIEQSTDQFSE